MRNLKLETPRMIGSDVEDWQNFLTAQDLYDDTVDGIFGPLTARATRDYQRKAGLAADGIVGPGTMANAIRDGFVSSTRPVQPGMDASVDCTSFASCIADAGMKFVIRYYSKFARKAMSPAEARALSDEGLKLGVVYQDRQNQIADFSGSQGTQSAAQPQPSWQPMRRRTRVGEWMSGRMNGVRNER